MNSLTRCLPLLGSFVEIYLQADVSDAELVKASQLGFAQIQLVQTKMSFHDENSELSNINKQAFIQDVAVSTMMQNILIFCNQLSEKTGGIFDISTASLLLKNKQLPSHSFIQSETIGYKNIVLENGLIRFKKPLSLDLGGIAKGFAVDEAFKVISQQLECKQLYINAGGDLKYLDWQNQAVLIPNINKQTRQVILQNAAIATSSSYYLQGRSDIYHPKTQQAANFTKTLSVFASDCMVADGLTKIAALMPENHPVFNEFKAEVIYT